MRPSSFAGWFVTAVASHLRDKHLGKRGHANLLRVAQVVGARSTVTAELIRRRVGEIREHHRAQRRRRQELDQYEEVIVYDEIFEAVWPAKLPREVIYDSLGGIAGRWLSDSMAPNYWGASIGGVGGWFIMSLLFAPVFTLIPGVIMGLLFGGMLGAVVGWMIGPRYGPKPIWTVRRCSEDDQVVIIPVQHTFIGFDEVEVPAVASNGHKNGDAEEEAAPHPRVIRASSIYNLLAARAQRRLFKSASRSMKTLELMGVATIAVAMVALVGFFAIALAG